MRFNKWYVCSSVLLLSSLNSYSAFADQEFNPNRFMQSIINSASSSAVVTLSAGTAWESAGDSQTLNLEPNMEKQYAANHDSHTMLNGELFVGTQHLLNPTLTGQIGLALATTGNANPSGDIWDDADVQFNNYTYNYKIQHTHVAVKGKLLMDSGFHALKPYISGSLGIGFNRAYDFSNSPTIFEAITMPNFSSSTTTAFTYTVGIGVEKTLDTHWQAGIGYEFSDWGKTQLGSADGQTTSDRLTLNHLYTNGIVANLTWMA